MPKRFGRYSSACHTSKRVKVEAKQPQTVGDVLYGLVTSPMEHLVRRWNWKSAITSSLTRGGIFFTANLSAGFNAAVGALLTEFVFRTLTSGFYGALIQAFRRAEPAWTAAVATMIILPLCNHSLEFLVHWSRGTPKLARSIIASVCFTIISTTFNLYAMRKGALVVGDDSRSLWWDMKQMPRLILAFILVIPRALYKALQGFNKAS